MTGLVAAQHISPAAAARLHGPTVGLVTAYAGLGLMCASSAIAGHITGDK